MLIKYRKSTEKKETTNICLITNSVRRPILMNSMIDCFFIGNNQIDITHLELAARMYGVNSNTFRDLNLTFCRYKNELYGFKDMFNLLYYGTNPQIDSYGYLRLGENFNSAIAYLGTYLARRGLSFDFVNSFEDSKPELANKLEKNNILAVAIPTTLYTNAYPVNEIISFVRQHNKTAKIIVGGPFIHSLVRYHDKCVLQNTFNRMGADFYIYSPEGEQALYKLILALKNSTEYRDINNVYYRENGSYVIKGTAPEDNDLEQNMIDWNIFNERLTKFVNIRTSKSCPFSCSFCVFPTTAGKYKPMSLEAIEAELNTLKSLNKDIALTFIDDTLNVPPERFKKLLRLMIKNKYNFKWQSYFRCQYADRETVEMMKESGCQQVLLGLESGSEKMLQIMNKAASVDKYKHGIELLNEFGICSIASFIVGFPGETLETYRETFNFIEEAKPTFIRSNMWMCLPGSPILAQSEKYKITGSGTDWTHETMDSDTAMKLAEEMHFNVKNSIGLKGFEFDYDIVFHLLQRGLHLEQIKNYIKTFNMLVLKKLKHPGGMELSDENMQLLKSSIMMR
jgi:anaerobic magnesium-protoporphyrin IX monomethyl ester cyclase